MNLTTSPPFAWTTNFHTSTPRSLLTQGSGKYQKSAPDSVGICLIFSWHDKTQEQPNIKHITQPRANQQEYRQTGTTWGKKQKREKHNWVMEIIVASKIANWVRLAGNDWNNLLSGGKGTKAVFRERASRAVADSAGISDLCPLESENIRIKI